jgi:hypothetical protein
MVLWAIKHLGFKTKPRLITRSKAGDQIKKPMLFKILKIESHPFKKRCINPSGDDKTTEMLPLFFKPSFIMGL